MTLIGITIHSHLYQLYKTAFFNCVTLSSVYSNAYSYELLKEVATEESPLVPVHAHCPYTLQSSFSLPPFLLQMFPFYRRMPFYTLNVYPYPCISSSSHSYSFSQGNVAISPTPQFIPSLMPDMLIFPYTHSLLFSATLFTVRISQINYFHCLHPIPMTFIHVLSYTTADQANISGTPKTP